MYYLVSIWAPRPEWAELRAAERQAAVDGLLTLVRPIRRSGVTLVSAGRIGPSPDVDRGHSYAIWEAASADLIEELERAIDASAWRQLVDYTPYNGANIELDELLQQQVDLGA